jgi:uncharacterized protein (TIGR03435 family)
VSVKRNTTNALGSNVNQRADGGFTMLNIPVATLISRAYTGAAPIDMVGLRGWAMSERYDVSTTSSLSNATLDERTAMLRTVVTAVQEQLGMKLESARASRETLVIDRLERPTEN